MAEENEALQLDPRRAALIIQDLQNDVMVDGGAFAETGAGGCTKLEVLLAGLGVDTVVVTGAWTNMSVEHTARTGADKGFTMIVPEDACSTMNSDWHDASINYALQNVSTVTSCSAVLD